MTFLQELILALVQGGLLAATIAALGYLFDRQLQKHKARDELRIGIAETRVKAYQELWALTKKVKFSGINQDLTLEERRAFDGELVNWYYDKGGQMFLSFEAARRFVEARKVLCRETCSGADVRQAFSALRTMLKFDCGVYQANELDQQLPVL